MFVRAAWGKGARVEPQAEAALLQRVAEAAEPEELQPEAEQRMRDFLGDNPQDKHGTHTYTFAETGLDEGKLREQARRYQDYFDVPSESLG